MTSQSAAPPSAISHAPRSFSPIRVAILLFLFVNCVYLLTSTGRVRTIDEIDPVLQSDSLLLRHSSAIPQAVGAEIWFGKRDVHGVPRSAWPVGHAVLVLPWNALGHYALAKLPGLAAANADLAVSAGVCWSNATFAALAVSASFLLFLHLGAPPQNAVTYSLLLAFCTPLFVYSGWLYPEPATTAIFLTAAVLLFGTGTLSPTLRSVLASLLLAFSIHIRPANLVVVLVFIGAAFLLDRSASNQGFRNRAAILAAFLAASVGIYLLRNQALFGNPFDYGVPPTAENGKDLESWHNPLWVGVVGYLFSPGKSIFLFAPPIILGILGLPALWRRNRPLAFLCAAVPFVSLLLYSIRTQWEGGYNYGPRYLVPSVAFLCLPTVMLFQDRSRWFRSAFWAVAVIGFLVQAIGLSTNILEDMVRNHYYVGSWTYRMSYSPITGQLRLIWKYLRVPSPGLGLGWDRWFVFLHAAGAPWTPLLAIASLFLLGAVVFGIRTLSAVHQA